MADPILELDAASSNLDGTSPGTSMLLVDSSNGWGLISLDMPSPEPKVLWTSNIDMDGSRRADPGNYENRTVTAELQVERSTAALCQAQLRILGTKIGKLVREGGTLKVTWPSGNTFIFDVVAGSHNVTFDHAFVLGNMAAVTVTFTCLPGARGAEEDLGDNVETTLPYLSFTEASIKGDLSAYTRIVVDEDEGFDQWWAVWGVETSAKYDITQATAALFYEAEGRTPLGAAATAVGPSGASGGGSNVVRHTSLATVDQAILSTQATGGGAHLTHVGSFRVFARVQVAAGNAGDVTVSFAYSLGDFRNPAISGSVTIDEDQWVVSPVALWRLLDLGVVTLGPAKGGTTQRWEGRILARSSVSGDDVDIDYLMFVPVDIASGEVSAVATFQAPTSLSARDEFDQTAWALAAKTLPVGGTWSGTGDADDFVVETTGHTVQRTAVSDGGGSGAPMINGRVEIAGTATFTNVMVQIFESWTAAGATTAEWGVFARYTDASNWLAATVIPGTVNSFLLLNKRVAGTTATLATLITSGSSLQESGVTKGLRLQVDDQGRVFVWLWTRGANPSAPLLRAQHADLATGGALATGKTGFVDLQTGATASTRTYDNFMVAVPTKDAATFASQSFEIGPRAVTREDSAGAIWTPVSSYVGDYGRVLPAGAEGRTTRAIVKMCRNDPATMPDTNIDNMSGRMFITPRYLDVPSA